jgi:hypothetical protein
VEWDWDDGGKSVRQEDCTPPETGTYNVKITMRHAARPLAVASATINVRPGLGDMSSID